MNIPDNKTREETLEIIYRVSKRIAPRYTFYGYTADDMIQESFFICVEALNRYDEVRPLENFLSFHLSRRLKNFVRDNHYSKDSSQERINVMQPAQLENGDMIENGYGLGDYEDLDYREMGRIVNAELPASMRMDYIKMINDVYIPKPRREEIKNTIRILLEEHGYYEEG